MKKQMLLCMAALSFSAVSAQTYETRFARPLSDVLNDVAARFQVRLKYDIDTVGRILPYADFRIRPYSLEETLTNVLSPFDYKFVKQSDTVYKLKPYEYARRTDVDGEKMLSYLSGLYTDKDQWEQRREILRKEVRQRLGLDDMLKGTVKDAKPILSKVRKFDGYTVQNFALETLPGLYVCGSVYAPRSKGKHALIICPNGHFGQGRYRKDQQQRMATLARMGAICVDYDLYGWGESALQVGAEAHHTSDAHTIQAMNGLLILDDMLANRKDIDPARIGVNGGSGGGTQTVLLTVLDDRFTAAAPVVSLASHFDGGCPCESGKPIQLAGGGTCNAELAALFAPRPMLVVSDGGDCLYCTVEGDNNIYKYIINTGKIVSVYEYDDVYKDVQVEYIENNGNYIAVLCSGDKGSFYERLDIGNQKRTIICKAENGLYCAGDAYLTTSGEEDADVYVYNFSRPRLKDIFTLDDAHEKNNMKFYSGSPYLLTSDEYIAGTKLRFYNVGRGVLSNEIVIPTVYKVLDADYLVVDQTLCIKAVNDKNERMILLWDIENIGEIKN